MKKKNFNSPVVALPDPEEIPVEEVLQAYLKGEIDLICVLGPTASGKTHYAVQLAREINRLLDKQDGPTQTPGESREEALGEGRQERQEKGRRAEIISADSRQFYRGMDIGTGKDLDEYEEIPYHLIDICPAGYRYNIYQYQQDFEKVYADIRERRCLPILCGGSGLYIKAAVEAYFETPGDTQENNGNVLIDNFFQGNRSGRSGEQEKESGEKSADRKKPLNVYYIGTLVSREERIRRIDRRLDARLEEGMVKEIKGLLDSGIPAEDLIYYGLEYKYVTLYVTGELTYEEMRTQLANEIHRFAKRQMTWFRSLEKHGTVIHWTNV